MNEPNKQHSNEPAFPVETSGSAGHQTGHSTWQFAGLTKRELIAAKVLSGLAVNQEMLLANNTLIEAVGTDGIDRIQACKAVRLTDALLAELEKPTP